MWRLDFSRLIGSSRFVIISICHTYKLSFSSCIAILSAIALSLRVHACTGLCIISVVCLASCSILILFANELRAPDLLRLFVPYQYQCNFLVVSFLVDPLLYQFSLAQESRCAFLNYFAIEPDFVPLLWY